MPVRAPTTEAVIGQLLSLLLVEDDRADALLVEELIADGIADIRLVWAQSMAGAEPRLRPAGPAPARRQPVIASVNANDLKALSGRAAEHSKAEFDHL